MKCLRNASVFLSVLAVATVAWACSTPVCRYAMYNWPATPLRVFHFHEGAPAKDDLEANRLLVEAAKGQPPLNVLLESVDVAKKDRFEKLPEVVRKAWQERPAGTKAIHAVFNPVGQKVFAGRLEPAAAKAMVDSPARKRLGNLLHAGNAGVLVLLTTGKEDLNRKAEQTIDELLRRVQAGEIAVPTMDGPAYPKPEESGAAKEGAADPPRSDPRQLKIARMTVSRTDPAETWFVRSLMSVEEDLGPLAEQPMVFAVYGRGRAMPPFVGKGITSDNLAEGVAFLAGACSCVVKDESPGVDLLVRWDWDATAEALAATEQAQPMADAEQSDGLRYQESSIPAAKAAPAKSAAKPEKPATADKPAPAPPAAKPAAASAPAVKSEQPAPAATPSPPASASYTDRQLRRSLALVGFVAVVVFMMGTLWFRRKQMSDQ